jgi:hypothetical protein
MITGCHIEAITASGRRCAADAVLTGPRHRMMPTSFPRSGGPKMNSPEFTRHCVAICQLSSQQPEDFNVNTELVVLENGEVHVSTWDAEPRDGGFDVHVLNDRTDALGFMVITDWEFFDEKAYAVVERRPGR